MKRFLLFGGPTYYAGGGWNDFVSSHDTLEEAVEAADKLHEQVVNDWDWWHVVDASLGQTVQSDPWGNGGGHA